MTFPNRNHLAVLTMLGLSACTASTAASRLQASEALAADERAESGLREHHRHQHRGGVLQFVAMSLDTVEPGDASRPQVVAIQQELYRCMAPAGEVQGRLHLAIAEGVAAGAVDLAKVDGIIGQQVAAASGVRECGVAALDRLHAVLSPAERSELVQKVEAHWQVWREVHSEDQAVGRGRDAWLGTLTREVALTPEQAQRISAALHTALSGQAGRFDHARTQADLQAFGLAFEAEAFDARTSIQAFTPGVAAHGATRMAIFYETVTPLLTPAQRADLAEHLRAHAGQHPNVSSN